MPTNSSTPSLRSCAAPASKPTLLARARHVGYAAGWKKFEGLWNFLIRTRQVSHALPILETVLSGFGRLYSPAQPRPGAAPLAADSTQIGPAHF